jgi:hypothetical protein
MLFAFYSEPSSVLVSQEVARAALEGVEYDAVFAHDRHYIYERRIPYWPPEQYEALVGIAEYEARRDEDILGYERWLDEKRAEHAGHMPAPMDTRD